jgi:glycosyltransferase involved in cell wall biosynthesis
MKLAIYLHDLSGGGVERMRLQLIPPLQRLGAEVTLVLHARRGPLRDAVPPDVAVLELGGARTVHDVLPLVGMLRRVRPDVLLSSLDHNNVAAMLARLAAGGPTRLVICQHNALSAEAAQDGWKYRAVPTLYRHLGFAADAVVAVSQGVADDLVAAGVPEARIQVIRNPVIDDGFAARAGASIPDPWLDDRSVPVFVFAGRLVAQKDPQTLLQGFALHRARTPARLLILGDGPLRGEVAALAERLGIAADVRLAGFQPNPLPFVRRAAALVLTSRYEGLGNVLIEALGCGTPVISTDCPFGPAEILQRGRYGRLVPVGDPPALAAAMAEPHWRRWPADLLIRRAADFTAAAAAARYMALFTALSGVRSGALPSAHAHRRPA